MLNYLKSALAVKLNLANPYKIKESFKLLTQSSPKSTATLLEKKQINYDSYIMRFRLSDPSKCLGLSIGQYIDLTYQGDMRPYVPISRIDEVSVFDILARDISRFPGAKAFSKKMAEMKPNEEIGIAGPHTQYLYQGFGKLTSGGETKKYRHIGIIAEETAITMVYSLIDSIAHNFDGRTSVSLLWLAERQEDLMFMDEFNYLQQQGKLNFNVMLTKFQKDWLAPYGTVTQAHFKDYMPPPEDDTLLILAAGTQKLKELRECANGLGYKNCIQNL